MFRETNTWSNPVGEPESFRLVPEYIREGSSGPSQVKPLQGGIGPGCLVEGENGQIPAKDIVAGDRVLTREGGFARVLWAGRGHCQYGGRDNAAPIRLAPGALGTSTLNRTAIFAPAQRLMLRHGLNEVLFGAPEVLCRTADLSHLPGIAPASQRFAVNWVHLLLEATLLIQIDGHWLESMSPDMPALRMEDAQRAAEIVEAVPVLRYDRGSAAYQTRLPVLNANEARALDVNGL